MCECMRGAGASLLVGGNTHLVCVCVSVVSRLYTCVNMHVKGREKLVRKRREEHRDQLHFYSPFDFSVNTPKAEAST